MTAQDLFNKAMNDYDQAKVTIRELTDLAQKINPEFSFELAMKEFDSILQSILITVAASDGVVTNYERQLVEKITDYADILDALNAALDTDFSWDDLEKIPSDELSELAEALVNLNEGVAECFVTPFAALDSITAKDYLDELLTSMGDIVSCMAAIDGDAPNSRSRKTEFENAANAMKYLIVNTWESIKDVD